MKHVNNFLLRIPIKLTVTVAYIVNTLRVFGGCIMCRDGIVPQSLALFDSMYVGHLESKERLRIQPAELFHFS